MLVVENAQTQNETKKKKANVPRHPIIQCWSPTIFQRWEYQFVSKLFKSVIRAKQKLPWYYTKTNAVTLL